MGIDVSETSKNGTIQLDDFKVKVGDNFTQDCQGLSHQNKATAVLVSGVNSNQRISLINGYNLVMAILTIDAQLADGIM